MITKRSLLDHIREDEVVGLCQEMVRFNTVNPPGNEKELAEFVADLLQDFGLRIELISHTNTRASVIAQLKGSGELPPLMYNGHLDVVPIGEQRWRYDPFSAKLAEGKIWGRGTADMKGGNAAILSAIKALVFSGKSLRGDIIVAFTAGEEGEQLGARALVENFDSTALQALVIPEPSGNAVYTAEKGCFWLKIVTHGKTAHGSMPEHGLNAIQMMTTLIDRLEKIDVQFEKHPLLGKFTRSIGTIKGGVKTNVVPDRCEITIDQRTVPGQDNQAILAGVEGLIAEMGEDVPGFDADVEVINELAPVETSPNLSVVQKVCGAVAEITGKFPKPEGVNYYTDGAVLSPALDAPLIICGPGEPELAHQPNEYVGAKSLVENAKILALLGARLLG